MKKKYVVLFLLIATCGYAKDQFPIKRSKHAHILCDTGILIDRGGNKWLTTEIILKNGERRHYYRVAPDLIDGKYYDCDIPPSVDNPMKSVNLCDDWPSDVLLGKTRVRIIYWWGRVQGRRDRISDGLFTLPDAKSK